MLIYLNLAFTCITYLKYVLQNEKKKPEKKREGEKKSGKQMVRNGGSKHFQKFVKI